MKMPDSLDVVCPECGETLVLGARFEWTSTTEAQLTIDARALQAHTSDVHNVSLNWPPVEDDA